jgi:hypothetical protein
MDGVVVDEVSPVVGVFKLRLTAGSECYEERGEWSEERE